MQLNKEKNKKRLSYLSLFSGAGIGCFGFDLENFLCIATVEKLAKRLRFQKYNNKCTRKSGYISEDMSNPNVISKIQNEISYWEKQGVISGVDVLVATPPCQGMSVANHKKKNEIVRNSLVVESIKAIIKFDPKIFIIENVRTFLNTICTDIDGNDKKIREAIESNLSGSYHILFSQENLGNYGSNSSRNRTLVIGTRKNLNELNPYQLIPDYQNPPTLRKVIGDLPRLKRMGEINSKDIYHNYRSFELRMLPWIKNLKEGESAFDNNKEELKPNRIINGKIVQNKCKNGDKYRRCFWDKLGPCIHTRNDILASQNTLHPEDNRVFSIRELMLLMTIPSSFKWSEHSIEDLNALHIEDKRKFLKERELNIRHCIGEAVPTEIFRSIADKIKKRLDINSLNDTEIKALIKKENLTCKRNLVNFIQSTKNVYDYTVLSKIAELSNSLRVQNSAYYTRQDVCFTLVNDLPDYDSNKKLRILEPSVGVGNFLPLLFKKYRNLEKVRIDVVDIDKDALDTLKHLVNTITVPRNFEINYINHDFLLHDFSINDDQGNLFNDTQNKYDIIIGNPPFGKIKKDSGRLPKYKSYSLNKRTNNIFSFFIEKCCKIGDVVALITPKSLLNAPVYEVTRKILGNYKFTKLSDYGEKAFRGVKIETIGIIYLTKKTKSNYNHVIKIESFITNNVTYNKQGYLLTDEYPYWIIYRNEFFDEVSQRLTFNIFSAFRDRQITKKLTNDKGKYRVLKSRNIGNNRIINIERYDSFIDDIDNYPVGKYINSVDSVLVPNLTYKPRACFLPKNCITDGSVAILTKKNGSRKITKKDLEYYSTDEFRSFYMIARNYGSRSLNIDSNSVYFFGVIK